MTAHYDGRRFFNPGATGVPSLWALPRMLLTRRARWPSEVSVEPRRPPTPRNAGDVIVTFIGHASFLIQIGTTSLMIDPVYSERASPVAFAGPHRVRQPGVPFDVLPAISAVLLSHNHYDHCDRATLQLLDELCELMVDGSLCALGGLTPFPVLSAIRHFPEDFDKPAPKPLAHVGERAQETQQWR